MPEETLSEKIARDCTALEFVQIPNDVIEAAKLHILDSLGCLFAGTRNERYQFRGALDALWNDGTSFLS